MPESSPDEPFRDSKLTRILQSSLGGNARTAVVCCASPASSFVEHSISTLRFGSRALRVQCKAVVNEVDGDEALLHRHRSQIQRLRARLSTLDLLPMSGDGNDDDECNSDNRRAAHEKSLAEKLGEQDVLKAKLSEKLAKLQTLILTATSASATGSVGGGAQWSAAPRAALRRAKSLGPDVSSSSSSLALSTGATTVTSFDDASGARDVLAPADDAFFRAQRAQRRYEALQTQVRAQITVLYSFTLAMHLVLPLHI